MSQMDRVMACALTEAGYMPVSEYIQMFGDEIAAESAKKPGLAGNRRTHARAARPARYGKHPPTDNTRRMAS